MDKETLDRFSVTDEQLESLESDAAHGVFHGEARKVVMGRPRLTDEPLRAITVTLPESMVKSIDERSKNRSDFIRKAIAACL